MKPLITVVVCSHNGASTLPATLQALANQTADGVEILVVDDGSRDDTAAVAEAMGVRVIRHATNRGLAAARNTGWRSAEADLVAFTDDDCRPEPTWLALLLAAADRHAGIAGIGGGLVVCGQDGVVLRYLRRNNPLTPLEANLLTSDGLLHRLSLYLRRTMSSPGLDVERPVSSIVGANMLFPVTVLANYDGFDERFRFGGEEEDLCRRLVTDGLDLVFVPTARVQHDFESSLRDTLRRSRAYGRGNARMFLKHSGLTPTLYPLPLLVGAVLVLSLALRRSTVALAGAAAPLLLFSRWPREAARDRTLEPLLYPYLQLAQETWGNVGLLQGLRSFRGDFVSVDATPGEGTDSGTIGTNDRTARVRQP